MREDLIGCVGVPRCGSARRYLYQQDPYCCSPATPPLLFYIMIGLQGYDVTVSSRVSGRVSG